MQSFQEHSIYLEDLLMVETSRCCLSEEFGLLSRGVVGAPSSSVPIKVQ